MKRKLLVFLLSLSILIVSGQTVFALEATSKTAFTYLPSGGKWTEIDGILEKDDYIDGIKIQTDISKNYYLQYATFCEDRTTYLPYVTSIENDYAGKPGKKTKQLKISVINKTTGESMDSNVVVLYRVKADGRWLPWVSNADPEWMYFVQRKYGISGVLDTASGYAGLDNGSFITNFEIRIFEETEIIDSVGESDKTKIIDVPFISQVNSYPSGCESVSAVMAMNYNGMNISVDDFIDFYLPKGSTNSFNPNICFGGDPRTNSGMGCYAPVIETALNEAMQCYNLSAQTIYGSSLSELCKRYIDKGIPVILWATTNMDKPKNGKVITYNDSVIQWISPEHCLVLVGYDENNYIFNDPLSGKNIYYSRNKTENAYCGLGLQAVIINGEYEEKHTAGEWITVTEPTVISDGVKHKYCSVCSKLLYTESIKKLIYYGDLNKDNKLDSIDITEFRKILISEILDYDKHYLCDLNINGEIDLNDFVSLKKKIVENY